MRALRRLASLAALSPGERRLLFDAWLRFFAVELALRTHAFPRVARRLEQVVAAATTPDVERLGHLVEVAARVVPFRVTCLSQALVLGWLLARAGMPVRLRFGVTRAGDDFQAHAWLESEGRPIFGLDAGAPWVPLRVAAR